MPRPGVLDTNPTARCPFCSKDLVARYLYSHCARSHFSDMWSERNLGSVRGALSASVINPVTVKMGEQVYFLNPVKRCLYIGMETWKRSIRTLSLTDYKSSLAEIVEYVSQPKENVQASVPPLAEQEREAWKKMVQSLVLQLTSERKEVARQYSVYETLKDRLLAPHFTEEEVLNNFLPLTKNEVMGHEDSTMDERRKALQKPILVEMPDGEEPSEDDFKVNLQTVNRSSYAILKQYLDEAPVRVVPEATQSGASKPKPSEKRPSKPTSSQISAPPVSEVSPPPPPPQSVPEPVSVAPVVSVAPRVVQEPSPAPAPAPPEYAREWVMSQPVPQHLQYPIYGMKRPVKKAQSVEDRRLTLLTT